MRWFDRGTRAITEAAGSPAALGIAILTVLVWAAMGPFTGFSDTWQLYINTGTTISTGILVFVIQATQNRDNRAIHIKLDEIIEKQSAANNEVVALEEASDEEREAIHKKHMESKDGRPQDE